MVNSHQHSDFESFFKKATGFTPFPYQKKMGEEHGQVKLLKIPTGAGKTASTVLSWVWKRRYSSNEVRCKTPRRLVYCLPMRVLVDQTYESIVNWLDKVDLLSGEVLWVNGDGKKILRKYMSYEDLSGESTTKSGGISVYKLMGGEREVDWDINPESDSIIVGTQDMLLSRALNRGYAVSRFRWPIQYGLLNNDCHWVMDELQLMGNGFSTSVQLEAFREQIGTIKKNSTTWMSATCEPEWLETVDHSPPAPDETLILSDEDHQVKIIEKRINAAKSLEKVDIVLYSLKKTELQEYSGSISKKAIKYHVSNKPTITLVLLNTVERAQKVYSSLLDETSTLVNAPEIHLIHSRFRSIERSRLNMLLGEAPEDLGFPSRGRIIVSTQVVEAGVDLSSCIMITELAPWASMVQRFGRLNRYGEYRLAKAIWIDVDTRSRDAETLSLPYSVGELDESRKILVDIKGVSLKEIDENEVKLGFRHDIVLRRKDLLELFDTTPDLSGNDVDVSRFIRNTRDLDVNVFWRDWETIGKSDHPPDDLPRAIRDELCPVSINSLRDFQRKNSVWVWDHLDERWVRPFSGQIFPGQIFLINCKSGGYDEKIGWLPDSTRVVKEVLVDEKLFNDATGTDPYTSLKTWVTLSKHSQNVANELKDLLHNLGPSGFTGFEEALTEAVYYHDVGKAHPVFQAAVLSSLETESDKAVRKNMVWGKSGRGKRLRYSRKYFRHELVSALMLLQNRDLMKIDESMIDLMVYLVGAHHGKIRLSIRSLPEEDLPWLKDENYPEGTLFARGVWEGDNVPSVKITEDRVVPETSLKLDYMGIGLTDRGEPSWLQRMINLRDGYELGPFRLGYLEAITRVSDWRASIKESRGDYRE